MKDNEDRIPLVIVAKGGTEVSENKYEVVKNKDEELILHSPKGWTNGELINIISCIHLQLQTK